MRQMKGFTLVEMLVVVGIIGLLTMVMTFGFTRMRKTVMRHDAQRLVSEVAVVFNRLLLDNRKWPQELIDHEQDGIEREVCYLLQKNKLLDISTYRVYRGDDKEVLNGECEDGEILPMDDQNVSKVSLERFGILDPWGRAELKRTPSAVSESASATDSRIPFRERRLQYLLDKNFDGYVDDADGKMPRPGMRVRGNVIIWSRGEDGKDDGDQKGRYPVDDILSWIVGDVSGK